MTRLPHPGVLHEILNEHRRAHGVPGAVVGLSSGDDVVLAATGTARIGSDVAVTPQTTFLIASVTKVWTATLVMQLVDEGLVDPTAPVATYLDPPLRLGDPDVARLVTVGELLSHSGGFFGDAAEPDFRGDDAVARLVETYASLPQLHRRGSMFAYCNSGYNVLGRLVECVTGLSWDEALRGRLIEPLGLTDTSTVPEETMTRPLAVGHVPSSPGSDVLVPVKRWQDARGSGPCGGTLATTAGDLLTFARLHLNDGVTADGRRLLSAASARAMRTPQILQPDPSWGPAWGWGWAIERLDGPAVVGHIGSTAGQKCRLVLVPEKDFALCVIANGDAESLLRDGLASALLHDVVGIDLPTLPSALGRRINGAPYVGEYRLDDETVTVSEGSEGLQVSFAIDGDEPAVLRVPVPLESIGGESFRALRPPSTRAVALTFVREDGQGAPVTHLAMQLRAFPRLPHASAIQDSHTVEGRNEG